MKQHQQRHYPAPPPLPTGTTPKRKRKRKQQAFTRDGLSPAAARAKIEAAFSRKRRWMVPLWVPPAIASIWMLAGCYYFLMPPVYYSKWSFILPVSNSGSTVSLQSIGQTTSSPSQPFGDVSLSPKVVYKEIAASEQVLSRAAKSLNMTTGEFGKARVKLIAETSLMKFRMSAREPELAQAKARALMAAFEKQLDILRLDEINRRAAFVRKNLKTYRANLEKVRKRMRNFQRATGLLSIEQYKEASLSVELLQRQLTTERGNHKNLKTLQGTLIARVGLTPKQAAQGVRLASDPSFARLAKAYGENTAALDESSLRFGPNHPQIGILKAKAAGSLAKIERIAKEIGMSSSDSLRKLILVANNSNQSDLFKEIVSNESKLAGSHDSIVSLEQQLEDLKQKVASMSKNAAEFEALQKDLLVAEAVFTSAAARLDIGKADLFESYPMVQVLAQPDLPESRSQPRLSYALAAGILGSMLILLAWGALWARNTFSRKR